MEFSKNCGDFQKVKNNNFCQFYELVMRKSSMNNAVPEIVLERGES